MAHARTTSNTAAFSICLPKAIYEDLRSSAPDGMNFRQYAQRIILDYAESLPTAKARRDLANCGIRSRLSAAGINPPAALLQ